MNMKWGVVVLLLAVIVAGCVQSGQRSSPALNNRGKVIVNIVPINCSAIWDSGQRDVCLNDVLITKKDVSVCDQFSDFDLKIKCYADVAASTQNQNICVKLTVDAWRDSCYHAAAVSKQDPVICANIIFDETRKDCYSRINLAELDEKEICSQLWTAEQKAECHIIFRNAK